MTTNIPWARDPRVLPAEKAVLLALSAHGTGSNPTTYRLAAELGLARTTIQKLLNDLRDLGAISWTKHNAHNYYKLLPYDGWQLGVRDSKLEPIRKLDNAREFWEQLRQGE